MTTEELLKYHEEFCNRARDIMRKKNHDYSGADGKTPFANFEVTEKLGVTTTEKGLVIRILDKLMRIITWTNCGELKVNESVEDACLDNVNYHILMAAHASQKQKVK